MSFQKGASEIGLGLGNHQAITEAQMECSTRRMEQVAKLLAEEIAEKMAGQRDINEMESMM